MKISSKPKKSLGQHFLMHASIAERMVEAAGVAKGDTVLEIGPGTGLLTRVLLGRSAKVIAIEADGDLVPKLQELFSAEITSGKLVLLHEDIRAFDSDVIKGPYRLVANIPYYITGELFRQFLSAAHKPLSLTFLIQKEVAERIARPQKGKEGLLSLSVKAYGSPKYCFTVPKGAFMPPPKVDSAVLSIENVSEAAFRSPEEERRFFSLLHAGFAHKRKLLRSNLAGKVSAEAISAAFTACDIPEKARAEDVSLAQWLGLARALPIPGTI